MYIANMQCFICKFITGVRYHNNNRHKKFWYIPLDYTFAGVFQHWECAVVNKESILVMDVSIKVLCNMKFSMPWDEFMNTVVQTGICMSAFMKEISKMVH